MDLYRHINVLKRFWPLVLLGLVLGAVLAVLTAASPSWDNGPKLTYRNPETWQSQSTIFLTAAGFPEGRTAIGPNGVPAATAVDGGLSNIYSQWAVSDQVKSLIGKFPSGGAIEALPVQGQAANSGPLPLLTLITSADTATGARALNQRTSLALRRYVESEQARAGTPANQRVRLSLLNNPSVPVVAKPRPMTLPIAVFILSLFGCIALAYILENMRLARAQRLAALVGAGVRPSPVPAVAGDLARTDAIEVPKDLRQVN
ncbi:MAG: hypothetical protein QOJ57_1655 [Thermoleophilaceae bacterium]|jgi:hypothetical protein|nr:hypothetical protein [Thermoleophilaceae bacterium]